MLLFQYWSKISSIKTDRQMKNVPTSLSRLLKLFNAVMTIWQCPCKERATARLKAVSENLLAELFSLRNSCHALSFATEAKAPKRHRNGSGKTRSKIKFCWLSSGTIHNGRRAKSPSCKYVSASNQARSISGTGTCSANSMSDKAPPVRV